ERLQRDPIIRLESAQKARGPIHGVIGKKLITQLAEFQQQDDGDRSLGGREVCNRLYRAVLGDPEILLIEVLQIITIVIRYHDVHAHHRDGYGNRESGRRLGLWRLLVLVLRQGGEFAGRNEEREQEQAQDQSSE